ncbi:MAG: hypothetical protein ACRD1P_00310 [Thermoanaerobaculia bacterium]
MSDIPVREGATRPAAAAGGKLPHGMPACGSPNPHDGRRCEREQGHEEAHGYRAGVLCFMIGSATTEYEAGSVWRLWR